jgi:hypothetical protein
MEHAKHEISISDFEENPVWYFDPDAELFGPLTSLDDMIGSIDELHFYAKFHSPQGYEFIGSLAGRGDTAIAIYRNERWYAANKNWRQTSLEQLDALANDSDDLNVSSGKEFLPLTFQTMINREPYVDWDGIFDIA